MLGQKRCPNMYLVISLMATEAHPYKELLHNR